MNAGAAAIRTFVVDDEPPARRGLALRLARHPDVQLVGQSGNGRDAIAQLLRLRPALLLLDVQMPGLDGFDVLRALPPDARPLTVFTTAHARHAAAAFDVHALDYLLKPIDRDRLADALDRVRAALHNNAADRDAAERAGHAPAPTAEREPFDLQVLAIRDHGRTVLVPQREIQWIDAAGDYMCVHVAGCTHVLRSTLSGLLRRLDPLRFQRIHRSAIVNIARVRELHPHANGEATLVLEGGHRLRMSRTYRTGFPRCR